MQAGRLRLQYQVASNDTTQAPAAFGLLGFWASGPLGQEHIQSWRRSLILLKQRQRYVPRRESVCQRTFHTVPRHGPGTIRLKPCMHPATWRFVAHSTRICSLNQQHCSHEAHPTAISTQRRKSALDRGSLLAPPVTQLGGPASKLLHTSNSVLSRHHFRDGLPLWPRWSTETASRTSPHNERLDTEAIRQWLTT